MKRADTGAHGAGVVRNECLLDSQAVSSCVSLTCADDMPARHGLAPSSSIRALRKIRKLKSMKWSCRSDSPFHFSHL